MKIELVKILDGVTDPGTKLKLIHNNIKFEPYHALKTEYIEQLMIVEYIKGDEKILELGGNIGRTTIVMAKILDDDKSLVTVEPGYEIVQLERNRELNNMTFNIFNGALSYRPIWKSRNDWRSTTDVNHPTDYLSIKTITFEEIEKVYNITFDTFVIDCEGAFYYILQDNSNILKNIKKIIFENDFIKADHKEMVHKSFINNGFKVVKEYPINDPYWGSIANFWQVWLKTS